MSEDTLQKAGHIAAHLPGLLLQAETVAHTFMKGVHGRRRVGLGETFWQFRHYMPGDSRRDIDWKQTAKRDGAYVRQLEWEAAQTVWIYRDGTESMDFASAPGLLSKKDYAEVLLLALSILLLSGGEQVGLLGTDLAPQAHHDSIRRLYDHLPRQKEMVEAGRAVAARSHAVLIGDFYTDVDEVAAFCGRLALRGVHGTLVQVCDPAEEKLEYTGRVKFLDMETPGGAVTIPQVESVRAVYEERFKNHRAALEDMARRLGWTFMAASTATPPEKTLAALYDAMGGV